MYADTVYKQNPILDWTVWRTLAIQYNFYSIVQLFVFLSVKIKCLLGNVYQVYKYEQALRVQIHCQLWHATLKLKPLASGVLSARNLQPYLLYILTHIYRAELSIAIPPQGFSKVWWQKVPSCCKVSSRWR